MSFMPSCRHITEHSSEYLDKTLPFWKRMGMRLHLFMCVNCRRYLQHLQLTVATLGRIQQSAQDTAPDPATVDAIAQQLRQEAQKPVRER